VVKKIEGKTSHLYRREKKINERRYDAKPNLHLLPLEPTHKRCPTRKLSRVRRQDRELFANGIDGGAAKKGRRRVSCRPELLEIERRREGRRTKSWWSLELKMRPQKRSYLHNHKPSDLALRQLLSHLSFDNLSFHRRSHLLHLHVPSDHRLLILSSRDS